MKGSTTNIFRNQRVDLHLVKYSVSIVIYHKYDHQQYIQTPRKNNYTI